MEFKILATRIFASLVLFSCSSATEKTNKEVLKKPEIIETASLVDNEFQNTIKLDKGFEILVGGEEDFENFKTYTLFRLNKNGTQIYQDSSLTEYEFGDKLYPLSLPFANEKFGIMVEVNDRPNKNYLKHFIIKDNKILKIEKLPTFISQAKNLDLDTDLEFAGFWDYPQTSSDGKGLEITAYNPILYYHLKKNGLELDSALTIERNTKIFGKFSGYEFKESIEVPASTLAKHTAEVERVKK